MRKVIKNLLFILCILSATTVFAENETSRIDKALTIYTDVLRQLDINYADTLNYEQLIDVSIHQMLRKVDPYTVYMPEDKTRDLRFMTTGKYGGIGAMIMQRDKAVYISEPYEGKPAQKNDVRAGDKILSVDGKDVLGKSRAEVSNMLRGVPHSKVTLKLQREGEKKPIEKVIEREDIKINPVDYTGYLGDKIGYIAFSEFTENSADIFRDSVSSLVNKYGIESLIIDLRGNGGGIIDEAIKIVGLFVEKGTEVVSTKGKSRNANRTYRTSLEPMFPDMKLMLLVNSQSASAAEIVSGSMQDLDRATLIGTRTYGKGLVQTIRPIAFNGHLKVTTSKYYIPSGRCIQAIDYSKRRQDGSVERVPDSLTHEFKTRMGRIVRDGGGIEPDILMEDSAKVDITYALYAKSMFFDYATRYRSQNETLPTDFVVSDSLLQDFEKFLDEKKFTYETETAKYFNDLLDMAHHEDLDSALIVELENLKPRLTPTYHTAILRRQQEVKDMLAKEIIVRYYFQKGVIEYNLKTDEVVGRAKEELMKD